MFCASASAQTPGSLPQTPTSQNFTVNGVLTELTAPAPNDNSTKVPNTAWVNLWVASQGYLSASTAAATYLSTSTAAATYAPISAPALTGAATSANTPSVSDSSTLIANTGWVHSYVGSLGLLTSSSAAATYLSASAAAAIYAPIASVTTIGPASTQAAPGCTVAAGASACRTPAVRAADLGVNALDFAVDNTGLTDAGPGLNTTIAQYKAVMAAHASGTSILKIPPGYYLIQTPVNLEYINQRGAAIDASGVTFYCQTNGAPCVSIMGSRWIDLKELHIYGSSTLTPSIGIQYGRTASNSCAEGVFDHVVAEGYFTFTAVYAMGCETQAYYSLMARNLSTHTASHAFVFDGSNNFGIAPLSGTPVATNSPMGMHEVNMPNLNFVSYGTDAASSPLWISHMEGGRLEGYMAGASQQNTIVWAGSTTGSDLDDLIDMRMDLHTESLNSSMLYEFFIEGTNTAPNIYQWDYQTSIENASTAVYQLASNLTAANLQASTIVRTQAMAGSASVFGQPSLWTASGLYGLPAGSLAWNLPNFSFNGMGMVGNVTKFYGDGSNVVNAPVTYPSTISASLFQNQGGVTGFTVTGGGHYDIDSWCQHSGAPCSSAYAHQFPQCSLPNPGIAGAQGTCQVTAVTDPTNTALDAFNASGFIAPAAGGTGYAAGQIFGWANASTYCTTPPTWKIQTVSGSAAATYTVWVPGVCQSLPPEPITTTCTGTGLTCTGTGLTQGGLTWAVYSIAPILAGSYPSTPAVTIQNSPYNNSGGATATVQTNASLAVQAGSGQLTVSSAGTSLGVAGSIVGLATHVASTSTYLSAANLSACGTSPAINATATDTKGTITEGATATGCTLTFQGNYSTAPDCTVSSPTGSAPTSYSPSTLALTIVNPSASGAKFNYSCVQ